jgi:hypothetical protein
MERNYLICTLIGRFTALDQNISADDLRYKIDEKLLESCMTPIDTKDVQLLDEVLAETMISVMGRGVNREQRRDQGIK